MCKLRGRYVVNCHPSENIREFKCDFNNKSVGQRRVHSDFFSKSSISCSTEIHNVPRTAQFNYLTFRPSSRSVMHCKRFPREDATRPFHGIYILDNSNRTFRTITINYRRQYVINGR